MIGVISSMTSGALNLAGRIPIVWWLVIGLAAVGAWNRHQFKSERAQFDRAKVEAAAARAADAASAATEHARREAAQREIVDAQAVELARIASTNGSLVASGRELRSRLAALRAASCSANPQAVAAAASTAGGGDPGDLQAYVQRRLDEAAEGIAEFATQCRVRALGVERAYDSLTGDSQ